ncbi:MULTISPECIES: phage minor tail U family protein [Serratia]|uniref:phage minor tail U family protein n=1 Tax=Serratia TaxID=613 RepID=UPI001495EDAF|nr:MULTISPECIES: phage minor tail U family protein [Serratia]MBH2592381.1 phage tail protein [Serratia marcescens]MBH3279975.1 phage tail protein [Serratia marcescens]MCK1092109.1 phage minor tail U family protein [Serratia marcescens]MDQ7766930.1 phage minor tail U family protein [Serratia nevei]WAZ00848.1 phage minor tail U family protein [Serratia marcescens]
MIKHTAIRNAVLERCRSTITDDVTYFDGRPAFIDENDLPAVAVFLDDARYTGSELDTDSWRAMLHIVVYLKATQPDAALDQWVEEKIYPVLNDIPELAPLVETMSPVGYDYQRDDEVATWGAADLSYQLTYTM